MNASKNQPVEVRFRANLADRFNLSRVAESVRDVHGSPFLDWETALRFSLDIARRVLEAGELDRFRAVPAPLGVPSGPLRRT
jgi:hypothetical protein